MAEGLVPAAVTHNDAKQNNVLFDRRTKKAVAVIDLDTLMPGSRLYDFGEALRLGCGNVREDSADRSGMQLDLRFAKAFASGYLPVMKDELTETEGHSLRCTGFLRKTGKGLQRSFGSISEQKGRPYEIHND